MLKKVLVVDDSALIHGMYQLVLLRYNCEMVKAMNGQEALDILAVQRDFQLILLDIHMPVMNGDEMISHLRENDQYKNLPVIVISSESDPGRIEMIHKQGAIFIHKPFKPETLKELIIAITGVSNEDKD